MTSSISKMSLKIYISNQKICLNCQVTHRTVTEYSRKSYMTILQQLQCFWISFKNAVQSMFFNDYFEIKIYKVYTFFCHLKNGWTQLVLAIYMSPIYIDNMWTNKNTKFKKSFLWFLGKKSWFWNTLSYSGDFRIPLDPNWYSSVKVKT